MYLTQKDTNFFTLIQKKIFTSRHVKFLEDIFLFSQNSSLPPSTSQRSTSSFYTPPSLLVPIFTQQLSSPIASRPVQTSPLPPPQDNANIPTTPTSSSATSQTFVSSSISPIILAPPQPQSIHPMFTSLRTGTLKPKHIINMNLSIVPSDLTCYT